MYTKLKTIILGLVLAVSFSPALAQTPNQSPIADAGLDQVVNEGSTVSLDGSGSNDPDGNTLTYSWQAIAGALVQISGANTPNPSFVAPTLQSGNLTITIELTVSDGDLTSADTVNITVKNVNTAPTADAGTDQTVSPSALVTLNGSASFDADGDSLLYFWEQLSGSTVSISDQFAIQPTFTAPGAAEVLEFQLSIFDGELIETDTVIITIANLNQIPLADAGSDQSVGEGDLVTLDGSASSDPDGDALTYEWTQTSGPTVTLDLTNPAQPSFTAPNDGEIQIGFNLAVFDGQDYSTVDSVTVSVFPAGSIPNCDLARARGKLWPPNHKMAKVSIVGLRAHGDDDDHHRHGQHCNHGDDDDVGRNNLYVTSITQDEPTTGTGRGDTGPDAVVKVRERTGRDGDLKHKETILLRKERAKGDDGRVYTINFRLENTLSGMSCEGSVKVCVPGEKRKDDCVDSGQAFDSFQ